MDRRHKGTLMGAMLAIMSCAAAQEPPPSAPVAQPTQAQKVKKEVGEAVDAIRDYSLERRQDAIARAQRETERLDRDIERVQAQMEQRWKEMNLESRQRSQAVLADLRQRRLRLAEWSGSMRHSSREAWDDVKAGFISSYHELDDALRQAAAEFQQPPPPPQPAPDDKP